MKSRKFVLKRIKTQTILPDEEIILKAYVLCCSAMENKEKHETFKEKAQYVHDHYSVSLLSVYEDGSREFIVAINEVNEALFCLCYEQIESRWVEKIGM